MTKNYLRQNDIEPPPDDDVVERVVQRAVMFDVDELADWFKTGEIDESRLPEH